MKLRFLAIVGTALTVNGAWGQNFAATSDRFGYGPDSTVTVYSTLEQALSSSGGTTYNFTQEDGELYINNGVTSFYPENAAIFGTDWYSSTDGLDDQLGNPFDHDAGFVQLYDLGGTTVTSQSGGYSTNLQTFSLSVSGENATYAADFSRLWNANGEVSTDGTWLTYSLNLTATGLNAVYSGDGMFTNTTNASSYSGSFTGLFYNTSGNDYYVVNMDLNSTSWAASNHYDDPDTFVGSVPGPVAALPFAVGLLRRRRNIKKSKSAVA